MKTIRRYFFPPRVHMGPHGNEMCDHFQPLASLDWCLAYSMAETSQTPRHQTLYKVLAVLIPTLVPAIVYWWAA